MRQRWSDERAGSRKVHIHQGPELEIRRVCEEGCGAYPRRSAPCPPGLREPRGSLTAVQKSAEGIVGRRAGRRPERSPQGGEGKGNSLGRLMTASRSPIPTAIDRVIQQAVLQQLQPLWDPTFSEHAYGFRPGRSAHQAVAQAQAYVIAGYQFVVDIDLAQFFDYASCYPPQEPSSVPNAI